ITVMGILLGVGGIVLVFYNNAFAATSKNYFLGVGLALIAMLSWSCAIWAGKCYGIPNQSIIGLIYLIIAGSLIAMMAFMYTMKHLNPTVAVMYAYINPIIAMITGTIMLKEHLSLVIIVGSLITLTGVYLVNYSFKKGIPAPVE
ncbi:unnamed protein product, partial [Rotaria sp. Silwood1]